jgi:hypothetical protein
VSDPTPNQSVKVSAAPPPTTHSGFRWSHWLAAITLVLVAVYDAGELVKQIRKHEDATSTAMFSMPSDLDARYIDCDYHWLFSCTPRPGSPEYIAPGCENEVSWQQQTCTMAALGKNINADDSTHSFLQSIPLVGIVVAAIVRATQIPGALRDVLKQRYADGSLQFTVGLFFALAWIALMAVALRAKSPENLLWFALVVVFGPYLLTGVFWLLQHAFDTAASGVDAAAAYILSVIGLPGCILMCTAHDAKEIAELFKLGHKVREL